MIEKYSCDLLVIGAGPAGATAAMEAAQTGCDVMIVDKKIVIGEPVTCAGYIPAWITQHIKLNRTSIKNKIDFMRTFLPDNSAVDTKTPGYIVDRAAFDRDMVHQAVLKGAKLFAGMRVTGISDGSVEARFKNKDYLITARIIIGADGPKSITGKYLGCEVTDFIIAKQYEMALKKPINYSEVYFRDDITGGYAWLFPKGDHANVGVGMIKTDGLAVPKRLDEFVEKLVGEDRIIPNSNVRVAEGIVPISGHVESTVSGNVILAGDAGGFTHPITGAGILGAVITGKEAGLTAAEALKNAGDNEIDTAMLKKYEREWKMFLRSDLDLASNRRKLLNGYFNKEHDKFKSIIEAENRCWVAYEGYWHDDK